MRKIPFQKNVDGQAAMEYLIVLGLMTVIALTAFRTMVPTALEKTKGHFNAAAVNIIGDLPDSHAGGPWP